MSCFEVKPERIAGMVPDGHACHEKDCPANGECYRRKLANVRSGRRVQFGDLAGFAMDKNADGEKRCQYFCDDTHGPHGFSPFGR